MSTDGGIDAVVERMQRQLASLEAAGDGRRHFHATYLRTTVAVKRALHEAGFLDVDWVERWDVVFADLYLDAVQDVLDGRQPPRPWAIAFAAATDPTVRLPPLRLVLLGMNAHINYDLPQALVAVISSDDFDDEALIARREHDHRRIDDVLASRVSAEDAELGPRPLLDRLLAPFNRQATRQVLRESRAKVWRNARTLDAARRRGPDAYRAKLAELEDLSAARVADLTAPGQVMLRLARKGFGVLLDDGGRPHA